GNVWCEKIMIACAVKLEHIGGVREELLDFSIFFHSSISARPFLPFLYYFFPHSPPEGERGYLEGLASRYADLFRTHYGDVLEPLEELRRRETNASARMPNTQLTTSHSQPIYVPGKYSPVLLRKQNPPPPSSCLSDKEEDEIYGFGYGVFSRQMLQHRQQKLALATQNTTTAMTPGGPQATYQSCLSPRSAFFYEFPPNARTKHKQEEDNVFEVTKRAEDAQKRETRPSTRLSQTRSRKNGRSSKSKCVCVCTLT
ncbi:hypothetical protein ALC60_07924, partial [Trachymyrmex zeteki]